MKTVIEMAREAGCALWEDGSVSPALERFAELVRAAEREACAKTAEDMIEATFQKPLTFNMIADTIRARTSS